MPSNSDLYESDDEFALNSPSDGYFNRQYSPNVLVPDPSLNDSHLDKAREARQEENFSGADESANAEIGSHRRPSQSASQTSYRRRIEPVFEEEGYSEQSPLLSAPPPYSAADSSNRRSTASLIGRSRTRLADVNNTNMGQLEAFPQYSRPQDMGGQQDPETLPEPWWQRLKHYISDHDRRLGRIALILTAIIVGTGFIANAIVNVNHVCLFSCFENSQSY